MEPFETGARWPLFLDCNRRSASRASAFTKCGGRAFSPCRRERTRGNRRPLETAASSSNPPGLCRRKPRSSMPASFPSRASYSGCVEGVACLSLLFRRLDVMLDDFVVFGATVGTPNANAPDTRTHVALLHLSPPFLHAIASVQPIRLVAEKPAAAAPLNHRFVS